MSHVIVQANVFRFVWEVTLERTRTCQGLCMHSFDETDQLGGFVPFCGDWHAEVILLQVCNV